MKTGLVFASGNVHKASEIRKIIGSELDILMPSEVGITDTNFPETSDTLEGNALQKVEALYRQHRGNCFSEDTGLEVIALNGAPGVYTARYAGQNCTPAENIEKLLLEMQGVEDRRAQFRTVIALIWEGHTHLFHGLVTGKIAEVSSGNGGFGYDPVFIPDGYEQTFAKLSEELKNSLSHRANATNAMLEFFRSGSTR